MSSRIYFLESMGHIKKKEELSVNWFLYLVRTARGTLYTGITNDLERRFAEHCSDGPKAAKALRGKGPLTLVFSVRLPDKSTALKMEIAIKKWPKSKKEKLMLGSHSLPEI
ncbi:GIY-YIG nuclease family protein [Microbulbifer sp. SSSA005]|uniref:GIY-YIG nuclease family protein n=1 Tax=Microbulbifer sp. SSSA005 TaxID=3243378 RepID=UPI004039F1C4